LLVNWSERRNEVQTRADLDHAFLYRGHFCKLWDGGDAVIFFRFLRHRSRFASHSTHLVSTLESLFCAFTNTYILFHLIITTSGGFSPCPVPRTR
jgi:hypothetical protein